MSEMKFQNVVTLSNSGKPIETAVMIGKAESPDKGLSQILADSIIPTASSVQAYNACKPNLEGLRDIASRNKEDVITVYQKDYRGIWHVMKQVKRGDLGEYAEGVINSRETREAAESLVTDYKVTLNDPSEFKKRGKSGKVTSVSMDVFKTV